MDKISLILNTLEELFPHAHCELDHRNNFELVIAVVLSAQTTDASVNKVTPNLFAKFPTPQAMADGDIKEIEQCISRLGLYRNKARSIHELSKQLVERFGGQIPNTMQKLTILSGVGRKCANVILSECFQIPSLAVDTHVARISKRLGLAKFGDSVEVIEQKLKRKIPRERWIKTHHQMIFFGRYHCQARNPHCQNCPLLSICKAPESNRVGGGLNNPPTSHTTVRTVRYTAVP